MFTILGACGAIATHLVNELAAEHEPIRPVNRNQGRVWPQSKRLQPIYLICLRLCLPSLAQQPCSW
jgi:hypothetical protein